MAKLITELSAAAALTGTELAWVEQSGAPVKATTQAIADLGGGGSSIVGGLTNNESGTVTLSTTADDYVEMFQMSRAQGAHSFVLQTVASNSGFSVSKTYVVNVGYDQTGTGVYEVLMPTQDSGVYTGNDYRLEINVTTTLTTVRAVRTSGATSGTLTWEVWAGDNTNAVTYNAVSATGTSAVTAIFNPHRIAGIKGTDSAISSHDGTDFNTAFANTTDWNMFGHTGTVIITGDNTSGDNILELNTRFNFRGDGLMQWGATADYGFLSWTTGRAVVGSAGAFDLELDPGSGIVRLDGGAILRIYDTAETSNADFTHSGNALVTSFVGTTNWDVQSNTAATVTFSELTIAKVQVDHTLDQLTIRDGYSLRIQDSTDVDAADFSHDGANFNTVFTTTTDWNISGLVNIDVLDGSGFRQWDSTNTDFIRIVHDGTDVNFTHATTTNWNITGITSIQAGTVDADFDALTATSLNGTDPADWDTHIALTNEHIDWTVDNNPTIIQIDNLAPDANSVSPARPFVSYDRTSSGADYDLFLTNGIFGMGSSETNDPGTGTFNSLLVLQNASDVRTQIVFPRGTGQPPAWRGYSTSTFTAWNYAAWTATEADADLSLYAKDTDIVHITGTESITGAKTFTSRVDFDNAVFPGWRIDATDPGWEMYENDAALDKKLWRCIAQSGALTWQTRTDADAAGATFLTVERTAEIADKITLHTDTTIIGDLTAGAITASVDPFIAHAANPRLYLQDTDAALDEKVWSIIHETNDSFGIRAHNDALGSSNLAMEITRTGFVPGQMNVNVPLDVVGALTAVSYGGINEADLASLVSPNFTGTVDIRSTGSQLKLFDTDDADTADNNLLERNGGAVNLYWYDNSTTTFFNWMKVTDAGALSFPDVVSASLPTGLAITGALTATSYGAVSEANLLGRTTAEALTQTWTWDIGAGGTALNYDATTSWVSGTLNLPGFHFREADGTNVGAIRAHVNSSDVKALILGTENYTEKLRLQSDNLHAMTGSLTLSGNLDLEDAQQINLGTGNDSNLRFDGANTFFSAIGASNVLNIRVNTSAGAIKATPSAAVALYYNGVEEVRTRDSNGTDSLSGLESKDQGQSWRQVGFVDMEEKTFVASRTIGDDDWHKAITHTHATTHTLTFDTETNVVNGAVLWVKARTGIVTLIDGTMVLTLYNGQGGTLPVGDITVAKGGWATVHKTGDSTADVTGVGLS